MLSLYSEMWVHALWGTMKNQHIFSWDLRKALAHHLLMQRNLAMEAVYVHSNHVHILARMSISPREYIVECCNCSRQFIEAEGLVELPFSWSPYAAIYSLGTSQLDNLKQFFADQIVVSFQFSVIGIDDD